MEGKVFTHKFSKIIWGEDCVSAQQTNFLSSQHMIVSNNLDLWLTPHLKNSIEIYTFSLTTWYLEILCILKRRPFLYPWPLNSARRKIVHFTLPWARDPIFARDSGLWQLFPLHITFVFNFPHNNSRITALSTPHSLPCSLRPYCCWKQRVRSIYYLHKFCFICWILNMGRFLMRDLGF